MTGYSFSTPVWEGGQWVAPAVTGVTAAARIVNGPEDQPRNAPVQWDKSFLTMGIKVTDGQVSTFGFTSRPLGPLAGAEAQISDPTRHRGIGGPVTATALTASVLGRSRYEDGAPRSMCPAGHGALPDLRPLPACLTWPGPSRLTFMRGSLQRCRCIAHHTPYAAVLVSDNRSVTFMASSTYAKSVRFDYAVAEPATDPGVPDAWAGKVPDVGYRRGPSG